MKLAPDENRREFVCWSKDAHTPSLRVELAGGDFYVFPYSRLQFARFESGPDQDTVHLGLDTHTVQITGKNLRELCLALQKLAVDWMRQVPARYAATANGAAACIGRIAVSEVSIQ